MTLAERRELAESILADVSKWHRIDIPSLRHPAQHDHFIRARKEFCRLAYMAGIGTPTIAKVLHKDVSTIRHHVADLITERKNACTTTQKNAENGLPA